jgi:hypothetical protein
MITLVEKETPGPEDSRRIRLALVGFRDAKSRHHEARTVRDVDHAYTSVVEAAMWVIAINDQLTTLYSQSYESARNRDPYGAVIQGVRWARNRHAHQLPVTVDEDQTPFFGGGKGIFSLSVGMRWRKVSELPPPNPKHPDETGERMYRTHLEGQNTGKTLDRCDRWFSELESSPTCLL